MPSVRTPLECRKVSTVQALRSPRDIVDSVFQPVVKIITAVAYNRGSRKGVNAHIPTAIHPTRDGLAVPRFPAVEAILGPGPDLHETWVTCEEPDGSHYRFLIAARYREDWEANSALHSMLPEVSWKGDLVVMRGGIMLFVVNMGDSVYRERAERAVRK